MRALMTILALTGCGLSACSTAPSEATSDVTVIGTIERNAALMDQIIPADANIEVLAEGFTWPEGPVWVEEEAALYFNDVPMNRMYRWSAETGSELFLTPSGGGTPESTKAMREPGANGIIEWTGAPGKLLLADHGARGLSVLDPVTKERDTITSGFDDKSLNSPNDIIARSDGALFFTDPPYGLNGLNDAPEKELAHNGVYFFQSDAPLKLVEDALSFPNGIALSPDEQTLYVAVSDPENPVIMAYDTQPDGSLQNGRVFFDASAEYETGKGLPDGMVVADNGTIFATGPAGVYVLAPETGEVLGTIATGFPTSNCTLDDEETYLYMTSSSVLARVPVKFEAR